MPVSAALNLQSEPRVGIVVLNYCSVLQVRSLIFSIEALDYQNCFVVVIDNASPDGSGAQLQHWLRGSGIEVIISPENGGYANGNNLGIRYAMAMGAEYIWVLNPDIEIEPQALSALVDCAASCPEGAAFGSKILETGKENGKAKIWGIGGTVNREKQEVQMLGGGEIDVGQYSQIAECDYVPGCSMFVSANAIEQVGYLPGEYFLYFEETDWCLRAKAAGFKLYTAPDSVVYHAFNHSKAGTASHVYYYNRSRLRFWFERASILGRIKQRARVLLRELPKIQYALYSAPNEHYRKLFRAHRAAHIDFLLGRVGARKF